MPVARWAVQERDGPTRRTAKQRGREGMEQRAMLGAPEEEDQSLGEPTCVPPQLLSPREQVFLEISIL